MNNLDPRLQRVLVAAERWAAFQEPDSLEDQKTDVHLRSEASAAQEALLEAVACAPCATCHGRGGTLRDEKGRQYPYCNCPEPGEALSNG